MNPSCSCPSHWNGIYPPHCPVHNPTYTIPYVPKASTTASDWDWKVELLKLKAPEHGRTEVM